MKRLQDFLARYSLAKLAFSIAQSQSGVAETFKGHVETWYPNENWSWGQTFEGRHFNLQVDIKDLRELKKSLAFSRCALQQPLLYSKNHPTTRQKHFPLMSWRQIRHDSNGRCVGAQPATVDPVFGLQLLVSLQRGVTSFVQICSTSRITWFPFNLTSKFPKKLMILAHLMHTFIYILWPNSLRSGWLFANGIKRDPYQPRGMDLDEDEQLQRRCRWGSWWPGSKKKDSSKFGTAWNVYCT